MVIEVSKNRGGQALTVERIPQGVVLKVGRSPNVQSFLPVPPGLYYDAVKLAPERDTLCVIGVAGGSAGHVAKGLGFKRVVGMEADPEMIRLGEKHFRMREAFDDVALGDCFDFEDWRKLGWDSKFSMIFFDAYTASDLSSKALDPVYLRFLVSRLSPAGVLAFNCPTKATLDRVREAMKEAGITAAWHRYSLNWVALVRRTPV